MITAQVLREMQCLRFRSLFGALPFARWLITRGSCSKLFVGGLSYDTNEIVLKEAFGQYGEITEVKVICDHKSGRSKGYGFVRFTAESVASIALQKMDGQVNFYWMAEIFEYIMRVRDDDHNLWQLVKRSVV